MADREEPKPSQSDSPTSPTQADGINLDERKSAVMHIDLPWEPATRRRKKREWKR